jgi:hypothetical protein
MRSWRRLYGFTVEAFRERPTIDGYAHAFEVVFAGRR